MDAPPLFAPVATASKVVIWSWFFVSVHIDDDDVEDAEEDFGADASFAASEAVR
jgi:hypothetical protein